jgi:hypothetical protein
LRKHTRRSSAPTAPAPLDPGDPAGPQTEIDQLIEAISFAPEPVLAKIRTELIEFMKRRELKETAPVGQDGRNLAADIFSKEMGVTQFLREMNRRVVMGRVSRLPRKKLNAQLR